MGTVLPEGLIPFQLLMTFVIWWSMHTILIAFLASLLLALTLTPVVGRIAERLDVVDRPAARKIHVEPIPRLGGIAVYLAFMLPFWGCVLFFSSSRDPSLIWISAGATVVFVMGLCDDVHQLRPDVKFLFQIVAALLACEGGLFFKQIALPWGSEFSLGWFSGIVTLFWVLLVVNAVNLIDGLDGLATGTSLFVSLVLLVLTENGGNTAAVVGLAALAGACMGFLRYNFNPASIFLGDCGSYFLGFILASLSILGSLKSPATVAIIIPIVALGLPLMDTILAPIRRFVLGRSMFQPDKSHIHHKLLRMGLSQRKAVLIMYGATLFLGAFALLIVHARDVKAGFLLLVLGLLVVFFIRKIGYLEYVTVDKVVGYFHDVTDVMGFARERRTFLDQQLHIARAGSVEEMWERIVSACELLKMDEARIHFNGVWWNGPGDTYRWCLNEICLDLDQCRGRVLVLELPLVNGSKSYGTLSLRKDLLNDPISHYTLRRIEHLRRTVVAKLKELEDKQGLLPCRSVDRPSPVASSLPINEIAHHAPQARRPLI